MAGKTKKKYTDVQRGLSNMHTGGMEEEGGERMIPSVPLVLSVPLV